ncbi:hypothetical protein BDN72DRAFT_849010, partial [Pluteus cervinus]
MTASLFMDLSTQSLTSLEIWNPGAEFIAGLVEGLGEELKVSLKELVIHGVNVDIVQQPAAQFTRAFQGLEKAHIALIPFTGRVESFLKFMAWFLGEKAGVPHSVSVPVTMDQSVHRHQVRELTLSEMHLYANTGRNLDLFRRLLLIGNIGGSLTTLRLRLRPPSSNYAKDIPLAAFNALPSSILELCPHVTHFHFLTWCPTPFLFTIPDRVVELGVRIAEDTNNSHRAQA